MYSQPPTQEELEERKAKIQLEIQEKEQLLQSVKSKEKSVVTQLQIQKEKIGLKEKLIKTTEKQTKLLGNDIYVNQIKINQLNRDLEQLRKDYTAMILKSYKSRSEQSRAMFLLSSENFLQAYKRAQYMKQYASYRKMQGQEIEGKTKQLVGYTNKIVVQKTEKEKLISENENENIIWLASFDIGKKNFCFYIQELNLTQLLKINNIRLLLFNTSTSLRVQNFTFRAFLSNNIFYRIFRNFI